jgi:hypothetical protein
MCAENEPAFYKMPAIWPTTMGNIGCTIAIFIGNLLKTHGDSNPVISWTGEFQPAGAAMDAPSDPHPSDVTRHWLHPGGGLGPARPAASAKA